jgi:hypothetical protein
LLTSGGLWALSGHSRGDISTSRLTGRRERIVGFKAIAMADRSWKGASDEFDGLTRHVSHARSKTRVFKRLNSFG